MIKIIRFVKRHPSLSREQFREYWLEHHAAVQREVATRSAVLKTVVSFTSRQFTTAGGSTELGPDCEPDFDAMLELHFRDLSDLAADFAGGVHGEVANVIIESERRFTDVTRSLVRIVAEEVVLVDKTSPR